MLADKTRSYRGIILGEDPYHLISEEGLEEYDVRDGDRELPREDGSIPGLHLAASKTIIVTCWTYGDTAEELEDRVAVFLAVSLPSRETQFEYRFKNPGQPERFVRARPLRPVRPRTQETETGHWVELKLALKAADSRIYSVVLHSEEVPEFSAAGGGFDFAVDFPINMTASTQQTAVTFNSGTRDAYPRFLFQYESGTVSGVEVINVTNGDVLDIDTALVAGQQVVADMDALIRATGDPVISIDGQSRYGDWQHPRDPFRLSPGSNTLRLETTGGGVVTAVVRWRDTD